MLGGCEYSIRIRPIATMERGTKGRILGDWSAVCKLSLPGIAKPAVPVFVPFPGDKVYVRWKQPSCTECEISSYDVATSEAASGEQGSGPKIGKNGKVHWVITPNHDIAASRPEQHCQNIKPQLYYVARVRAHGTAKKDADAKIRTEWSAYTEPFMMQKRMGGGFALKDSAATEAATAAARRRLSMA